MGRCPEMGRRDPPPWAPAVASPWAWVGAEAASLGLLALEETASLGLSDPEGPRHTSQVSTLPTPAVGSVRSHGSRLKPGCLLVLKKSVLKLIFVSLKIS